jgi:hypothetical protein
MSTITTRHAWIDAPWIDGDERTVYIESDYIAVVAREDNGEYGIGYRATVSVQLGWEELEVANELCGDADDARAWAEQVILDARA